MKSILEDFGLGPIGIIADLIDPSSDGNIFQRIGKTGDKFKGIKQHGPYLNGSISDYANDLIMTFPVLIDDSLSPEICSMIGRANERNIVTMLQLLFSSAQMNGTDGKEIIKSIYGKVKPKMSIEDYIKAVDNYVNYDENVSVYGRITPKSQAITENLIQDTVKAMCECMKEGLFSFQFGDSINEESLDQYIVRKDKNDEIQVVKEAIGRHRSRIDDNPNNKYGGTLFDQYANMNNAVFAANNPNVAPVPQVPVRRGMKSDLGHSIDPEEIDNYETALRKSVDPETGIYMPDPRRGDLFDSKSNVHQLRKDYNDALKTNAQIKSFNRQAKAAEDKNKFDRIAQANKQKFDTYKADLDIAQHRILDTDIKKANELQPTLMTVQYNELDSDNSIYDRKVFVCGVKSRLIPTDPADIIDRIVVKNRTKINFVNLIRATTGEIRFMKDFVLSIDQAKIDAKNSIKKGEAAQLWKALETMSARNNLNKLRKAGNDASAITVLVINKETANLLKKQHKYDIEKPGNAKFIMDVYNLLGIFIVDESIEAVKVIYRGNSMYEQHAFSYLEKEANDKSYKKVINLMGQMNRGGF